MMVECWGGEAKTVPGFRKGKVGQWTPFMSLRTNGEMMIITTPATKA
jgi:hypothetical protein